MYFDILIAVLVGLLCSPASFFLYKLSKWCKVSYVNLGYVFRCQKSDKDWNDAQAEKDNFKVNSLELNLLTDVEELKAKGGLSVGFSGIREKCNRRRYWLKPLGKTAEVLSVICGIVAFVSFVLAAAYTKNNYL